MEQISMRFAVKIIQSVAQFFALDMNTRCFSLVICSLIGQMTDQSETTNNQAFTPINMASRLNDFF